MADVFDDLRDAWNRQVRELETRCEMLGRERDDLDRQLRAKESDWAFSTGAELKERAEVAERQRDALRAEVEMLRGVGCNEDGDGPCEACIKCVRTERDSALAALEPFRPPQTQAPEAALAAVQPR